MPAAGLLAAARVDVLINRRERYFARDGEGIGDIRADDIAVRVSPSLKGLPFFGGVCADY